MTTPRGLALCAPSRFGTIQNILSGVVCARGQCAETARGQLICSTVEGWGRLRRRQGDPLLRRVRASVGRSMRAVGCRAV